MWTTTSSWQHNFFLRSFSRCFLFARLPASHVAPIEFCGCCCCTIFMLCVDLTWYCPQILIKFILVDCNQPSFLFRHGFSLASCLQPTVCAMCNNGEVAKRKKVLRFCWWNVFSSFPSQTHSRIAFSFRLHKKCPAMIKDCSIIFCIQVYIHRFAHHQR